MSITFDYQYDKEHTQYEILLRKTLENGDEKFVSLAISTYSGVERTLQEIKRGLDLLQDASQTH